MSDPIAVLLQFAFIAVLYLFLLWVARSALRDLRGGAGAPPERQPRSEHLPQPAALIAEGGGGLRAGASFVVNGTMTIGRSPQAEVQIDDQFASTRHARIEEREGLCYLKDMGSTNGTYLNGRRLREEELLRAQDVIRIGDTEFRYQC